MSKSKKMQRDALKQLAQQRLTPLPEPHEQDTPADVAEAQAWLSGKYDAPTQPLFVPASEEHLRQLGAEPVTRAQPLFQPAPPIPEGPPEPAALSRTRHWVLDGNPTPAARDPYAPLTTEQALTVRLLEAGMAAAGNAHEAFYDALHGLTTVQKLARRILGQEATGE